MTVPSKPARYLVTGRAGNGKSSFINAAFGRYIAPTNPFESCTSLVEHYALNTALGDIILVDTPGFADGAPGDDVERAKFIATHAPLADFEAVLYVTKLTETRLRPDEQRTLRVLTQAYGPRIWNKAWLVFTFAADIAPDIRAERVRQRRLALQGAVKEALGADAAASGFVEFRRCWLIDNAVRSWTNAGVPVTSVLVRGG